MTLTELHAGELVQQLPTYDADVAEARLGHSGGDWPFRVAVRAAHCLGIADPSSSRVVRFQQELDRVRADRVALSRDLSSLTDTVSEINRTTRKRTRLFDEVRRLRSLYGQLGDQPKRVLRRCYELQWWEPISRLREPLRPYWENCENWPEALECSVTVYLPAAEHVDPRAVPWVKATDIAWFAALCNERKQAEDNAASALSEFETLKEHRGQIHCYRVLGLLDLHDTGVSSETAAEKAMNRFGTALQLSKNLKDKKLSAMMTSHLASAFIKAGRLDDANAALDRAINFARTNCDTGLLVVSLLKRAELLLIRNCPDQAQGEVRNALFAADGIYRFEFARGLIIFAECYERAAKQTGGADRNKWIASAVLCVHTALDLFRQIGQSLWIKRATSTLRCLKRMLPSKTLRPLLDQIDHPYPFGEYPTVSVGKK